MQSERGEGGLLVITDVRSGGEEITGVQCALGECGGGGARRDGWTCLQ